MGAILAFLAGLALWVGALMFFTGGVFGINIAINLAVGGFLMFCFSGLLEQGGKTNWYLKKQLAVLEKMDKAYEDQAKAYTKVQEQRARLVA